MKKIIMTAQHKRRVSLLAVSITALMATPIAVMADESDEMMMFAEMSGARKPRQVQPAPRQIMTHQQPESVQRPVQPVYQQAPRDETLETSLFNTSRNRNDFPVRPKHNVVQPLSQPVPIRAETRNSTVSIFQPGPRKNNPPAQGGGFLNEVSSEPVKAKPVPAPAPVQKSTVTPYWGVDGTVSSAVLPTFSQRLSSNSTTGISPVSLNRNTIHVISEAKLRKIFLMASRLAWGVNPQLRSVIAQGEAANASIDEAKGQYWPQVDVTGASPSKQFGNGYKSKQNNLPSLGVSVATNIYDFSQTAHTIESREHQFSAAEQAVKAQRESIALQVSSALIEWNKQQLVIDISKQYVARMNQLSTMLSSIVQADAGRRSEFTQAKGRLIQAQSLLENAESRAREAEITLHRLLGNNRVNLPGTDKWQLGYGHLDRQLIDLNSNPVILRAQADAAAALKESEAIKASGLPKLNWVVSKSTAEDELGRQRAWQTGLNVSWGLFRGGSNTAQALAAVKRAEASRELVQEQKRELENRIRAADQDAHSMASRAELYKNLIVESERIRKDFFDQWYHLGRRTLLDVLSAETDHYNNQVSEVSNRFDSYSAIFRGYGSTGTLIRWLETGR